MICAVHKLCINQLNPKIYRAFLNALIFLTCLPEQVKVSLESRNEFTVSAFCIIDDIIPVARFFSSTMINLRELVNFEALFQFFYFFYGDSGA